MKKFLLTTIGKVIKTIKVPVYFGGMKINFPEEMTDWELGSTLAGNYEYREREFSKKYLKKDDRVLELGACIGAVSITINKILSDKTKQVSIEPNIEMLKYLERNKRNNKSSFYIENAIVSLKKEIGFHSGGEAFLTSSTLGIGNNFTVKGITIAELENKYFPFTALIMDIEGGELELLRNFDLSETKIDKIIWETHAMNNMLTISELEECYSLLEKYGFESADKIDNVEYWHKKNITI